MKTTRLLVSDGSGRGQSGHAWGWRGTGWPCMDSVVAARVGAAWAADLNWKL